MESCEGAKGPLEMVREAAERAALDAVGSKDILKDIAAVATMEMFLEMRWRAVFGTRMYKNFPRRVASALGANPKREFLVRSAPGGNGPQMLVNLFAEMISQGHGPDGPILITGCEVNKTFDSARRAGRARELKDRFGWGDNDSTRRDDDRPVEVNRHDRSAAAMPAILQLFGTISETSHAYACFENAARGRDGDSTDQRVHRLGRMLAGFSRVASDRSEHAWYPKMRSATEIVAPSDKNFVVAAPYTKYMCAIDRVDQSAAILLMSWARAREYGIADDRLVFLVGSGDACDLELFPLRYRLDRSIAMEAAYREAFRSAGLRAERDGDRIRVRDLYSCYPIAVENALRCLGLRADAVNPVDLTCTGGLAQHGGPGNNYVTHAICALVERLRERRGLGIVGANGGFLTEHSVGLYSTQPPSVGYRRRNPNEYAPDCGLPPSMLALAPEGKGKILAWTVVYDRNPNVPRRALIMGEMRSGTDRGKRFVGWTKDRDARTIGWLLAVSRVGEAVDVRCAPEKLSVFGGKYEINEVLIERPACEITSSL